MFDSEFFQANFTYISEVYKKFAQDPSSVDPSWKDFFSSLDEQSETLIKDSIGASWNTIPNKVIGQASELSSLLLPSIKQDELSDGKSKSKNTASGGGTKYKLQCLIEAFRNYGHLASRLDPLKRVSPGSHSALRPEHHELTPEELSSKEKHTIENFSGTCSDIVSRASHLYCGLTTAELSHIPSEEERDWLHKEYEGNSGQVSNEDKKYLLSLLNKAENLESYLHTKFPGAKRFSIEGGEAMIVSLEEIALESSNFGTQEVCLGMAHRGRLNTLAHFVGKSYRAIFSEFMGVSSIPDSINLSGDVKYHLGCNQTRTLRNGKKVYLTLSPNPSHLESVNPVVAGKARARQDLFHEGNRVKVLPVLIHGDAAMSGQGVVYETIIMSNLEGYTSGGTIHITINNQIGFTAEKRETNCSLYCTDVAKTIQAPIFHVNAYDIEGLVRVSRIAARYRAKYQKDAFIELFCYRKYGHNEGDEPMFTQPSMYTKIKATPTPNDVYAQSLVSSSAMSDTEYQKLKGDNRAILDAEFEKAKSYKPTKPDWLEGEWSKIRPVFSEKEINSNIDTSITQKTLDAVGGKISSNPAGIKVNPKIQRLLKERQNALLTGKNIDWATAELLAYGSLLLEGYPVRLSGEDCERGTFSHRHAVLRDQERDTKSCLLDGLSPDQAKYSNHNSPLSEFGVLGFEYGYSMATPNQVNIWEAQFGDFSNGAATIYDQYISSGEDKWLRMSGIISLLPHGFEGQGPEHSSARIERYLQYCADANMIVANCTTPANLFHIIRRQAKAEYRKPLVIMSPKSLLRHQKVISSAKDFYSPSSFRAIIGDEKSPPKAKRVIVTSGKVYYDLLQTREDYKREADIAIIRVEQYYPFHERLFKEEISKYKHANSFVWVQEEPQNMGAWHFIRDYLKRVSGQEFAYVGRKPSPSPASGFTTVHAREQKSLVEAAIRS